MTGRAEDPDAFAAVLAAAAAAAGRRKSERTRLKLLAATAALLDAAGDPAALRVADIADRAGVAHGTFYRYFVDRPAAVEVVAAAFCDFLRTRLAAGRGGEEAGADRARAATAAYVRAFRANAGLMRCLLDLGDDQAPLRARFEALNADWNAHTATAIARRRALRSPAEAAPADERSMAALLPTAYALGGMVDAFLAELYLRRNPALAAFATDEAAVVDLLTRLWHLGADGTAGGG